MDYLNNLNRQVRNSQKHLAKFVNKMMDRVILKGKIMKLVLRQKVMRVELMRSNSIKVFNYRLKIMLNLIKLEIMKNLMGILT